MSIKKIFLKLINRMIAKDKHSVYFIPHNNGRTDKYDLINYSADNILTLLNYLIDNDICPRSKMYVECYSSERIEEIRKYLCNCKIKIIPVLCDQTVEDSKRNNRRRIRNFLLRYKCKTWISCTPFAGFEDIVKGQTFICMSYSTPFKSGISLRHYDLSYMTHFLETSLLTASVHAAQYRNYLYDCPILGFPRNDTLFSSKRKDNVVNWISTKVSFDYKHIVVYAPTYRDYEGAYDNQNVLGYPCVDDLESFLAENNILLIVKFHPLQKTEKIFFSKHVLNYEKTYDFTLYDLLSISDMLISDYSSVVHDYIVTGKPIVINSFDLEKYDLTRGFAFEPIEYICPSPLCSNFEELKDLILKELNSEKRSERYYEIQKMFHKYVDGNSTMRVWDFLKKFIK